MRRHPAALTSLLWIVVLALFPRSVSSRETITWMEVNMPPFFIQEGPDKGQGYGHVISAILRTNMPEYDHFAMVTNVIRHFQRFKNGEKVCSLGLYRTPEREAFIHFSHPALLTLPPVLITRKDKQDLFGSPTRINSRPSFAPPDHSRLEQGSILRPPDR